MKTSNKLLLGGIIFPIILFIVGVIYFSGNSTEEVDFQLKNQSSIEYMENWNF